MGAGRSTSGSIAAYARRGGAAAIALTLLALVACDLWVAGFRGWWDRHSLTGSIVASLLVVGATGLIFDEAIARHQRRDRATSVAVQGMILYAQARQAFRAVVAEIGRASDSDDALEQVRPLANMVLSASPSLFDDTQARLFLDRLQRLMGSMIRTLAKPPAGGAAGDARKRLETEMAQLQASAEPLRARLPAEYRSMLDEPLV